MRRLLPTTLFGQLVLGTVVMQTTLLGLFIFYTVVSQQRIAQQHVRARVMLQLDRLSAACSKEMGRHDPSSLHDVLELSRIAPTVEVARVTDLRGNTLAVSDSGRSRGLDAYELNALANGARRQVFEIRNGQIEAVTPLPEPGRPVALLWLEPNHSVSLNTLNTAVRVALTYGVFALLANLIPIFLIVRSVTKPLRTLREATQRVVNDSDLDVGFPLPVTTANEAGELTTRFNAMVRELREQRSGLLETLALLDSMLGNAPIGFAFLDQEMCFVRLNQSFAEISGAPVPTHLKQPIRSMFAPAVAEQVESFVATVFETGQPVRSVELCAIRSGEEQLERSWLLHFYPVRTSADAVKWVGAIATEITERLRAEETLRKTEKLAATGRLAASIAHEINNPLEAVTNLLYLLSTQDGLDPGALQLVLSAQAELARVAEITQQTLRFYRQSTSPVRTNVAELLNSVTKLYQTRIHAAHLEVVRRFRGEPEVFGYNGELRQLFANLIANAVDASKSGGWLLLTARRGCGCGADGQWCPGVRVSVADTGTGMPEATRKKVFEAFFTTKEATGTGLGLWVSEEIVRKHAGTVRVRSRTEARSGTIFTVFFPDRRAVQPAAAQEQQELRAVGSLS